MDVVTAAEVAVKNNEDEDARNTNHRTCWSVWCVYSGIVTVSASILVLSQNTTSESRSNELRAWRGVVSAWAYEILGV